jgi:triphosphoribosyl-dephospho-CoA synthetase
VGQQHRQILSVLGSLVMAAEASISFKPGLVSENHEITNEGSPSELRRSIWRLI